VAGLGSGPARAADEFLNELKTVGAVHLEGCRSVGQREIRSALKTRAGSRWPWGREPALRLDFVRADTAAIAALYHHHGFLDVEVNYLLASARRRDQVVVAYRIREGPRSRIARVVLVGVRNYPVEQLERKLWARRGKPFDPAFLQLDTLLISAAYQERGFRPHTRAGFTRDSTRVVVRYEVLEGPQYRFGESYIAGLERVRERLVRRELVLPVGEVYRSSRVRQSIERLYESGLFDRAQISPIPDSTSAQILFYVLVHERKPRWIDAGLGTGTTERFRVTTEWGHRNVDRRGLQAALSSRVAIDGQGRFLLFRSEGTLLSPWMLGTRTPTRATVYYEQKADRADPRWVNDQETRGFAFVLRRSLNRFTSVSLVQDNAFVAQKLRYRAGVQLTPFEQDSLGSFFVEHYETHRLQLALDRDFRDSPVVPTQGSRQLASTEVAGGPFRGESSFLKHEAGSTWYTPLGRDIVLAARLRAGVIRPFGESRFSPPELVDDEVRRVPVEDRFRLGGVNSVRGYDENTIGPSGGLAMLLGNLELRLPLWGPLHAELFADGGNVWARPAYVRGRHFLAKLSSQRLTASDVRYTAGAGLSFNLPVGPVRVDWAWGLRTPEGAAPIIARWQFAIGPSF
jgi:outer membrane protein assembly complex protein YaeT